jgi:hypothetical protein
MAQVIDVLKRLDETSFFLTAEKRPLRKSAVKNQHVRAIKCVGLEDPYCEWEIV